MAFFGKQGQSLFPHSNHKHKRSLQNRARDILGDSADKLLEIACEIYQDDELDRRLRAILRKAGAKKVQRRRQYVEACLNRDARRKELETWLDDHPDPMDILTPEELRKIDPAELGAYYRSITDSERELELLSDGEPGFPLLAAKVGRQKAEEIVSALMPLAYEKGGAYRLNKILALIAKADRPQRYFKVVVERELD